MASGRRPVPGSPGERPGPGGEEEAEAVEDDEDGAAFVAEHAMGEGEAGGDGEDGEDGEGAEGDDEVLADDASGAAAEVVGVADVFEAVVHEDDVGLFECGVGAAGAHGDADMGGGEGGGVVDTITDHGDAAALTGPGGDGGHFLFRAEFGADFVEVEMALEVIGRGMAVAGEGDGMESVCAEIGDNLAGLGSDIVAEEEASDEGSVAEPDFGGARLGRGRFGRVRVGTFEDKVATSEAEIEVVEAGGGALAGHGFEVVDGRGLEAETFAVADDGAGEGMGGEAFDAEGEAGDVRFAAGRKAFDGIDAQFAGGEGAGLVHGDDIDVGEFFDGRSTAEEDAMAGAVGDGGEDGGRDGEDEGAGGGDDEEGHGQVKGAGAVGGADPRRAAGGPPDEEHEDGEAQDPDGVAGAEAVGEPLGGGFEALGIADEADDALEGAGFGGAEGDGFDGAPEVEGAAEDGVADLFVHGNGFAGEVGFVGGGPAEGDLGIDGEEVAGFEQEPVAGAEVVDGDEVFGGIGSEDDGFAGGRADEGADFAMGAA